jgi:hypothetical protein
MKNGWRVLLMIGVLAISLPGRGYGAIVRVDPTGAGDALTITGGLMLVGDGDDLLIAPGTYLEHDIVVNHSIRILGDENSWPIIDGDGAFSVFQIGWPNGPFFQNLVIQDAYYGILSRKESGDCSGPVSSWAADRIVLYGLASAGFAADNYACPVGVASWTNITAVDCGCAYSLNDYGLVAASRIVAYDCDTGVSGFHYESAAFDCAVFWEVGLIAGGDQPVQINRLAVADPLICDVQAGEFGVATGSPCLPENNACGLLIGAKGPACFGTAGLETSMPDMQGVGIEGIWPNPLERTGAGVVEIAMPRGGRVQLELLDPSGRRVWSDVSGAYLEAGRHVLPLVPGALPSGAYILRARANTAGTATGRLVILR